MFTVKPTLLHPALIIDSYVMLEGRFMVKGGHLLDLDPASTEESPFHETKIAGIMMCRYNLKPGQIFRRIGVLLGHYAYQPEESESFAIYIGDDIDMIHDLLNCPSELSEIVYTPNEPKSPGKRVKKFKTF